MEEVAVSLRSLFFAGSLGLATILGSSTSTRAQEPVSEPRRHQLDAADPMPAGVDNQQMADAIAAALRKHPEIRQYRIDVGYVAGVAELHGHVADSTQRDLVRQTVLSVPGVAQVRDRLQQVSAQEPVPVAPMVPEKKDAFTPPPPVRVPGPAMAPVPPMPIPPAPTGAGMPPEPMPIFGGPPGVGMYPNPAYQQPPLPPYAWPTYAPYNNNSRVAQPTLYNYNQFPFIGPMYPYPKIPLGWRRVTLEWQDGNWWYGRESNSHDWWRIRYW
jgi:BON domain